MQAYKLCPTCGATSALTDSTCASCGRKYNTQFASVRQNHQTQFLHAGPASRTTPGAVSPAPSDGALMAEMERQYKSLRLQQLFWFFLLWWGLLIGVFVALYYNTRLDAIRTTVARTGRYVADWEEPLIQWFWRMAAIFTGAAVFVYIILPVTVIYLFFTGLMHLMEHAPSTPPAYYRAAPIPSENYGRSNPPAAPPQSGISYGDNPPIVPPDPHVHPEMYGHPPQWRVPAAGPRYRVTQSVSQGDYPAPPAQPQVFEHGPRHQDTGGFSGQGSWSAPDGIIESGGAPLSPAAPRGQIRIGSRVNSDPDNRAAFGL